MELLCIPHGLESILPSIPHPKLPHLSKTFHTIDHTILRKNPSQLEIRGIDLKWFENYLHDHKQFITMDRVCSILLLCVTQGPILGILLFLIYINDLPQCTKLSAFLFANETTLLAKKCQSLSSFFCGQCWTLNPLYNVLNILNRLGLNSWMFW